MTAFDSATALAARSAPGDEVAEFAWEVPDGWQQGRGAWGGLSVGAIVRAVTLTEPDAARTARTISLQISAPALVGAHRVQVRPVRIGSGMSTWSATVTTAAGAPVASGVVITGAARRGAADRDESAWGALTPPRAPRPDDVPVVDTAPPFPVFTRHLAYRLIAGHPLEGGPAATLGWIGFREPPAWSDVSLLALMDAWYSVTLVPLADFTPLGTVNFTANLLVDPRTLPPGEPLLHDGFVSAAREGYASEHRRLWTVDGRLAVDNLQTIVVG